MVRGGKDLHEITVCEQGCRAIVNLCYKEEIIEIISTFDICDFLIEIIIRYCTNEYCCVEALKAIFNLINSSQKNALKFTEDRSIIAILDCFVLLYNNSKYIDLICKLFILLTVNYGQLYLSKISEHGACELICEIMKTYDSTSDVVEWCCVIITNLARTSSNSKK